MESFVRTTVFGQAVRLASRNRLLRYPDELDPSLWKKWNEKTEPVPEQSAEEQEKHVSSTLPVTKGDALNCISAGEGKVLLVGWYGINDPEASNSTRSSLHYC
jgi:DHA1 family multidrug resistance protein-like MFS transporter